MKKLLVSIGIFFTLLVGKVFAMPADLYGVVKPETAYGVMQPTSVGEIIIEILKIALIPVSLLIGVIVFIKIKKKKKSEKSDKNEEN